MLVTATTIRSQVQCAAGTWAMTDADLLGQHHEVPLALVCTILSVSEACIT